MTLTEKRLVELIGKWNASGEKLIIESRDTRFDNDDWLVDENPTFKGSREYREKSKPVFVNSISEEFYNDWVCVYYYNYDKGYDIKEMFFSVPKEFYNGNDYRSELFKTKSGALKAAVKYYENKGQ